MSVNTENSVVLSDCCICILSYNRIKQLPFTLENIKKEFMGSGVETIVLDNGSTDGTWDILNGIAQGWTQLVTLRSDKNLGCALGRETLWRNTARKYILSLDDDIILKRSDLEKILTLMSVDKNIGIVSPIIVDSITKSTLNPVQGDPFNSRSFYEGCFLINRSLINDIGYFDKNLMIAGEGLDYSIRLRKSGYWIARAAETLVYHVDRDRKHGVVSDRRIQWMWSFSYLYFKNYKAVVAFYFTFMNFATHVKSGWKIFGWKFGYRLARAAVSGALAGRSIRAGSAIA